MTAKETLSESPVGASLLAKASDLSPMPHQYFILWRRHRQTINHMHAIPRHILRVMLGLRCHLRQLACIELSTGLWM